MARRCIDPRCRENALPGSSRCGEHRPKTGWGAYGTAHPDRMAFYASPYWRQARAEQLQREPTCVVCGEPATHADHVTPVAEGGPLDGALQSMCAKHHRRKTLDESHEGKKRKAAKRGGRPS